jgi:uncharacterized protein
MLQVYVDETDMWGDLPLYEAIVQRLVQAGIAGATVNSGIMGYGTTHILHRRRLLGVSDDKPVTISVIEDEQKIRKILPEILAIVEDGPVILFDVEVVSSAKLTEVNS